MTEDRRGERKKQRREKRERLRDGDKKDIGKDINQ